MNTNAFATGEQEAIRRALAYWHEHWDWECPLLFGIAREDLAAVLQAWPVPSAGPEPTALAVLGALRELLHGASAAPKAQIPEILGLTYADAERLCQKTLSLTEHLLG